MGELMKAVKFENKKRFVHISKSAIFVKYDLITGYLTLFKFAIKLGQSLYLGVFLYYWAESMRRADFSAS